MANKPDVVFTPIDPPGSAIGAGLAGDGRTSDFSSGGNAWNAVDRPHRSPYLEFGSQMLAQLDLPLIFDGVDDDTSQEPALARLRSWRGPASSTGRGTVISVAGPVDTVGIRGWVVQSVAMKEAIRRTSDGARVQQALDLTLIEYSDVAVKLTAAASPAAAAAATTPFPFNMLTPQLQSLASSYSGNLSALAKQFAPNLSSLQQYVAAHGSDLSALVNAVPQLQVQVRAELETLAATLQTVVGRGTAAPHITSCRWTVVRPGDNLETVAQRELGDYRKYDVIGQLNGIRDPNHVHPGERLRLP